MEILALRSRSRRAPVPHSADPDYNPEHDPDPDPDSDTEYEILDTRLALVYVDRVRTGKGEPWPEYVVRMRRGVEEAGEAVGYPRAWAKGEGGMGGWL